MKGIDPKAREIAKDLARRSGMTLGEWLNQVILEDSPTAGDTTKRPTPAEEPAAPAYRRIEAPEHPGDELVRVTEALEQLSERIEAAENRSTQAITGVDQSVSSLVSRLTDGEREQTAVAARFEGLADELKADQNSISERLRRIEQETAGNRPTEALHAMEAALAKVADHLYEGEARAGEQLASLREDLNAVADRVERGAAGLDAADLIEAVVSRVAGRLEQAGARTSEAIRGLEISFAHLDERLRATESTLERRDHEAGLERIAATLSERVEAARVEMAESIKASAENRFERIERTLAEMNSHVQVAERRSAQAIERMGHEVLRMAEAVGRKVNEVEQRSAGAIEQVSGEMGRIAATMESRLTQLDNAGAQALEKLGNEIAKITERLSERISNAERRSAQAIDDVGDQMTRVSERLQDRHERSSSELVERIRQSEERTARLLEDARERIDRRLSETQRRPAETPAPAPDYSEPDVAPFGQTDFSNAPLPNQGPISGGADARQDVAPGLAAEDEEPLPDSLPDWRAKPGAPATALSGAIAEFGEFSPTRGASAVEAAAEFADHLADELSEDETRGDGPFEEEPYDHLAAEVAPAGDDDADLLTPRGFTGDAFEGVSPFDEPSSFEEPSPFDAPQPVAKPSPFRPSSGFYDARPARSEFDPFDPTPNTGEALSFHGEAEAEEPSVAFTPSAAPEAADEALFVKPSSTRELIEQARAAARASSQEASGNKKSRMMDFGGSLFSGFGLKKKAKRGGSTLKTMLLLSGVVAAAGVSTAGYIILNDRPGGALPQRLADGAARNQPSNALTAEASQPMAAVALNPTPLAESGGAAPAAPNAVAAANGPALYEDASRRIEAHDYSGVDALRKAANLGYAPAQFYLAKLYEDGQAGLRKDLAEARVWTQRAADAGDRKAMHNLALYYFEGTGGTKDLATAAEWFRKAANLGLVDSQYNLARLYEKGFGVGQNPAEAYKWYLIAARSGDADSRQSAAQLKDQLSPQAQAAAERAAQGFTPQGPDAVNLSTGLNLTSQAAQATATDAGGDIANLQRALSRLGYYQGPTDGSSSPALKLAVAAYQRDQGLPGTGVLDASSEQLLLAAAQ